MKCTKRTHRFEIWDRLMLTGFASNLTVAQQMVMKPFVEALPNVLVGQLGEKVSVHTVIDAKVKFVVYLLENDFVKKFAEASPELGDFESIFGTLNDSMRGVIIQFEKVMVDVEGFLKEQDITEERALEVFGLSEVNKAKYMEGALTIFDLLDTQPEVIVKNT